MKNFVIYTQYQENYGAADWDGTGECPQHWKNKGGSAYAVRAASLAEAMDAVDIALPAPTWYANEFVLGGEDRSVFDARMQEERARYDDRPLYKPEDLKTLPQPAAPAQEDVIPAWMQGHPVELD